MIRHITASRIVVAGIALVAVLAAIGWATRVDPSTKPYLKILGSGFLFNYRIGEVTYGFSALVVRPLPVGSIIEARFESPQGGPDLVVRKRVGTDTKRYSFQSPPLRGVEAGVPYHIEVTVFDREESRSLWRHGFDVRSQISDAVVPEKPLTTGPGYAPNRVD